MGIRIGRRISVVGTTGSGKTTTAQAISNRLKLPHIELDALSWAENWTSVPDAAFQARVKTAVSGDEWVIDGNYSKVRNLIWSRAETVVYLDYPFWRVFWQLLYRTIRRSIQKEELWSGNREDLKKSFFSKDSILLWMLQTYHRRRRQYPILFQQPEYAHLNVVRLKTPRMTNEWLASL